MQAFYADEMERHGFGGKTFTVETYADGTPVVHYMEGQYPEERYYKYEMTAFEECRTHFQDSQHVYLIVIDLSYEIIFGGKACGTGSMMVDFIPSTHKFGTETAEGVRGGYAIMPASGHCFFDDVHAHIHELRVTVHELGHAFGLLHDFRDIHAAIGGTGHNLSYCDAEWLFVNRFFNNEPLFDRSPGNIKLLSAPTHTQDGVKLRLRVEDADGLHQIQFKGMVVGRCGGGPNYQQGKSIDVKSYRTHSMPAIIVDSLRVLP